MYRQRAHTQPAAKRDRPTTQPWGCAVLVRPGAPRPGELLRAVSSRGARVRVMSRPTEVMTALALSRISVVILTNTDANDKARALLNAIRRHHPTTILWSYTMDDQTPPQPRLAKINLPNGQVQTATPPPPPDPERLTAAQKNGHDSSAHQPTTSALSAYPPTVRPSNDPAHAPLGRQQPPRDIPEPLLTSEELDFLLHCDEDEDPVEEA